MVQIQFIYMDSLKERLLEPYTKLPILPGDIIIAYIENPTNGTDILVFVSIMYNAKLFLHHRLGLVRRRRIRLLTRLIPMRINRSKRFQEKLETCKEYRHNDQITFVLDIMKFLNCYDVQDRKDLLALIR